MTNVAQAKSLRIIVRDGPFEAVARQRAECAAGGDDAQHVEVPRPLHAHSLGSGIPRTPGGLE